MKRTITTLILAALILLAGCVGGKKRNNDVAQEHKIEEGSAFPNDLFGTEYPDREVFEVRSATDFFNAVGSNRVLRVVAENIDLSDYPGFEGVRISNIENMTIEGIDSSFPADMYVNTAMHSEIAVLEFEECNNIVLRNLRLGHYPVSYSCYAPVVAFTGCEKIIIEACILYGCGTEGITANNTQRLLFNNSTIESCEVNAIDLSACSDFLFFKATIAHNNLCCGIILLQESERIGFEKSHVVENVSLKDFVVSARDCRQITFDDCVVENNVVKTFGEDPENPEIALNNTRFKPLTRDDYDNRMYALRSQLSEKSYTVDPDILKGHVVRAVIRDEAGTEVIAGIYDEDVASNPELLTHSVFGNMAYPVVYKEHREEGEEFNGRDRSSQFENMGGFVYQTNKTMTRDDEYFEYPLLVSQSFLDEFSIVPLNTFDTSNSWDEEPETEFQKEAAAKIRDELKQKVKRKVMNARLIGASVDTAVQVFEVTFVPEGNITIGCIALQSPVGISLLQEPGITTYDGSVWRVDDDGTYRAGFPRTLFKDKMGNYLLYIERPGPEGTNVFIYSERNGELIPALLSSFYTAPY
ncbi:MAG: right-handed parallel beta-helix repeat-containing protein [Fermentimonas sp.]|jgi:hypothetical protein